MNLSNQRDTDNISNINSFSIPVLRNLTKIEHKHILSKIIPDFKKNLIDGRKEISNQNDPSFEKVQDYYNSFLQNDPNCLLGKIENALVDSIVFDAIDEVLIYKADLEAADFNTLKEHTYFNKKIYERQVKQTNERSADLELLTIRKVRDNSILILFSHGIYKTTVRSERKSILFSCIIDKDSSTLQIKYQSTLVKNFRSDYSKTLTQLIEQIVEVIETLLPNMLLFNEKKAQDYEKNIYEIFKDYSEESESIIKNIETNKNELLLLESIENFLSTELEINIEEMGFDARKDELIQSYIKRVLSIYYQNVATNINDNKTFQSYLYAFSFLSSESTRSSTSKGKNDAIYKDDIFWRLKDVIYTTKRIKSIAVFERFNKIDPSKVYTTEELQVLDTIVGKSKKEIDDINETNQLLIESTLNIDFKIDSVRGGLKLHYNNNTNTKFERGLKNDYVITKIVKYL